MVIRKGLEQAYLDAQKEMPKAPKDGINPHFKSRFTTYDALVDTVSPVLNKNGLSFSHVSRFDGGLYFVGTVLNCAETSHTTKPFEMPINFGKPQEMGSAITYAKRYTLAAICGIASDEDDDGNSASVKKDKQEIYKGLDDQKTQFKAIANKHGIITIEDLQKLSAGIVKLKCPMDKLEESIKEWLVNPYMTETP